MRGIKRPSPAFALAFVALVVALSGAAVALPGKNSVDSGDIKKNAVKSSDIDNKGVKGKDLKNKAVETKKLDAGAVTENKLGDGSVTGSKLGDDAVTDSKAAFYDRSPLENVSAAASQAAAPEIPLLARAPFDIYGKCYVDGAFVRARIYIRTTEDGSLFSSDDDDKEGDSGDAYLNSGTTEDERELENDASAAVNDADGQDTSESWYNAISTTQNIEGQVTAYAKQGTPPAGNGLYGAGDRCIFHAWLLDQAG